MTTRQARYRERHRERLRQEEAARRERVRVRALYAISATPACRCCGERQTAFLVVRDGHIECRNCTHALAIFGYCPHSGVRWGDPDQSGSSPTSDTPIMNPRL